MEAFKLANANSSVISVTTTAASLLALINTAGSTTHSFRDHMDAFDIFVEDGDVRLLYDTNTPTSTKGILLKRGGHYRFRKTKVSQVKIISATGSSVSCSVQVGTSEAQESSSASFAPYFLEKLDPVNDIVMSKPYGNTPKNMTASGVVVGAPATLVGFYVNSTSAGTIKLWDNATAGSGTVINNTITPAVGYHQLGNGSKATNGVYATIGGTIDVTFYYNDPAAQS